MNLLKFQREVDACEFSTLPRTFKSYRWYKPILIFVLSLITYFILLILSEIFMLIVFPGAALTTTSLTDYVSMAGIYETYSVALIGLAIFIPTILLYKLPVTTEIFSIGGWSWSTFLKATLITAFVYVTYSAAEMLVYGANINNQFTLLTFVLCMIVTPLQCFAEEVMCRGFLMQTFGSWFRIPIVAIILQALIFTVLHVYNPIGLVDIFISGLCYGIIAWYSRGLEISTAMHMVNNVFCFVMVGLGLSAATTQIGVGDALISIGITVATMILIIVADRKFNWFGSKKEPEAC